MSGSKLLTRLRRASYIACATSDAFDDDTDTECIEKVTVSCVKIPPRVQTSNGNTIGGSLRAAGRRTSRYIANIQDVSTESALYDRFTRLPNELHTLILCELSLMDTLALRRSSRQLHQIVSECESSVVRHYIQHICTPLETFLYPPPPPGQATLQYLLNWKHRKVTARILAGQLCNFVAREVLQMNTAKKRREFDETWQRMFVKLQPLIFTLGHYFESYRQAVLERCATNRKPGHSYSIQTGPALWEDQTQIMDRYDPVLLLDLYHCYGFLLQAFERKLRPPNYSTTIERYLRGWVAKPASAREIEILLMLGGMDKISWVLGHRRYSERRRALDTFIRSLSPTQSPFGWRHAWAQLGVASPKFPLADVPATRLAIPALHLIWVPNALHLLLAKDVIEHVDFGGDSGVRSMRDFVSEMVGYDILRYNSPPASQVQVQHSDDSESELDHDMDLDDVEVYAEESDSEADLVLG